MDHAEASERLSAWIDGELAPREAAALEAHLAGCEGCRRELDEIRRTVAALSALRTGPAAPPQPDLVSGVVDRVRRRSRGRFFGPEGRRVARYEIVSAAMLVVVIVLYVMMRLLNPAGLDLQ